MEEQPPSYSSNSIDKLANPPFLKLLKTNSNSSCHYSQSQSIFNRTLETVLISVTGLFSIIKYSKAKKSMADFPEDLNYGITLDEPAPNAGTGYSPPDHSSKKKASVTDEQVQEAQNGDKYDLKKAAHPTACVATFAFKAAAIFSYLIIGSIIDSSIITFILVIMFSSLDFWVVKNVTGRLLVGLRWWSEIDKNGKETWRFENPDDSRNTNMVDSAFFWTSQVVGTAVWALLLVLKVLTLSVFWSLLVFVCLSLCGTNLYAYYQCRGDHQKKLGDIKKMGVRKIMENAF